MKFTEAWSEWRRLDERLENGGGEAAWTRLYQIGENARYWISERIRIEQGGEEDEVGEKDEEEGIEVQGDEAEDE